MHPYLDAPSSFLSSFGGDWPAPLFRPEDRLTHLVLVDGRLVDRWSEPVLGTRWEEHADRFDRELQRPAPVPPVPTWEKALTWLDDVCGGRAAVLALDAQPLADDGRDLPDAHGRAAQERLAAVAELLDAVALRCFDPEAGLALRTGMLHVHARDPDVLTDAVSAARVAGGVAWAVGKANGLLRPQGDLRMGRLQQELGLTSTISTYGKVVERALVGYRDRSGLSWWRPDGLPDLLPLGHPDLLLGSVRRRLVRVRDRALEARTAASA